MRRADGRAGMDAVAVCPSRPCPVAGLFEGAASRAKRPVPVMPSVNGRVMGLSGVIAHMSSSVRAGGMISDVLADVDGSGFAGVPLTASRLKRLLMRQRMPGESAGPGRTCRLRTRRGLCDVRAVRMLLADCLDVVGENHRISRLLHDSRRSAFAVPRATAALVGRVAVGHHRFGRAAGRSPGAGTVRLRAGQCVPGGGRRRLRAGTAVDVIDDAEHRHER